MKKEINLFMEKLRKSIYFDKVKFVILFGSQILDKANPMSDYDFAVYLDMNDKERFKFRIKFGAQLPDKFDLQIFQDLPLYVQKEVLRGKIIYAKEIKFIYDTAYITIKKFKDFKKAYYDYIRLERIQ